jgi:peptidoglycan/LPS O-acetylase OafA/YrhL
MALNSAAKLNFRYDINALRAIAILGVLLFHYKVPYFSGGFSGVDIFFVISGYLMSRIIINAMNKGNFSFVDFYGKRLKRIVPALLNLVLVITLIGFFIYFPDDFQKIEANGTASLLFLSNIYYWAHSGYFDPLSDTNMFLHTWSLSVEWQFYMIYPVALLLLHKIVKKKSVFKFLFIGVTLCSVVGSFLLTRHNASASFYFLPSRAWEMMFGGIAFLLEDNFKSFKYRKYVAYLGYFMLLAGLVFLDERLRWPGSFTMLPVFGTFIIITSNYNQFKLLSNNVIQFIGKISYSLYLWHWPVYVIAFYLGFQLSFLTVACMIITSLGLAFLSYRYIESMQFINSKRILAGMAVVAGICFVFSFTNLNEILFSRQSIYLSNYNRSHFADRDKQFDHGCCFVNVTYDEDKKFNMASCLKLQPGHQNILLIGDSHAAHFSESFKEQFAKMNVHLIQATSSGCYPLMRKNGAPKCYDMINYLYTNFIPQNAGQIDGVMFSANWYKYKGGYLQLVADFNKTIEYLNRYHIKVIIIGQNEIYKLPYPVILAKELQYDIKLLAKFISAESYAMNDHLITGLPNNYIDIINRIPFTTLSAKNAPYLFDENHFTKYGADLAVQKILADPLAPAFFKPVNRALSPTSSLLNKVPKPGF